LRFLSIGARRFMTWAIALADMVLRTPDATQRAALRAAMEETLKEIVKFQQTRGSWLS